MTSLNIRLAVLSILSLLALAGCAGKTEKEDNVQKPDTTVLSSKKYALAYQDGDKIVATSLDTINRISFGGATNPAISPDGNKLAYTVTDSAKHRSIWIADLENKSQLQLLGPNHNYEQAVWSASGNAVAFSVFNSKKTWKVGLIRADNSGYVMLDSISKTNVYAPTWKNEHEILAHDLENLYTYDLSGKLLNTTAISGLIGKAFIITRTSRFFYSKDGKKIVFNAGNKSILAGSTDISEFVYILDVDRKSVSRISTDGIQVSNVFLTADDRIFYSGSAGAGNPNKIYVSDLKGNIKKISDRGTDPTGALK